MKIWLLGLFFISSALFSSPFYFKDRLEKAKTGDYVVIEKNKLITVLAIRKPSASSVIFEEITVPAQDVHIRSWPEWIQAKAPGHSSWSMVEMDLHTGQILECYSFSRMAWVQFSPQENLLTTLLSLPLEPLSVEKQRRIGPPPLADEPDHRQIWYPSFVMDGKNISNVSFDIFHATWPDDGTELARKTISLYFDHAGLLPFPVWVQVDTSYATGVLRIIDSGKNLPAPYRYLPRRVPEFISGPQKTKKGLQLSLKSPKYYSKFDLFAVDITNRQKQIHPLLHSINQTGEDRWTLHIDQEELSHVLEPDHRYTWLLVPVGHSESYTEFTKPFIWPGK